MLAVLNTTDSLSAVMSGAAATTNPVSHTTWREAGAEQDNQASQSLNGATAVALVSAPSQGQRIVDRVAIYNGDTASVTVTVYKTVSGTTYTLAKAAIPVGGRLTLTDEGVQVDDPSGDSSGAGMPTTAVTAVETIGGLVHKTTLTMVNKPVTVGNTTGVSFGGSKIYDFPAGRILVLGVTLASVSFDLTDAGNVTPIDATMGGDIAVGSTVAGDGTLTGADVDLIPSTSIDPISGGVTGAALAASAQFDGTTSPLDAYFNILIDDADVGNAASDVLLVNGTLTITWLNCGDY